MFLRQIFLQNIPNIREIENIDFYENDGYDLRINPNINYFLLFLILILFVYYYYYKQKTIRKIRNQNKKCLSIVKNYEEIVSTEQNQYLNVLYISIIPKTNILVIKRNEIKYYNDRIFPMEEDRTLICFCDGSYSHSMQIGYAGFRTSSGVCRTRLSSPFNFRNGSTDTEVLAACLAIKYALKKQYNKLIIYTDNSKVEQILNYRKKTDEIKYRKICQILEQFFKENQKNSILVQRVRGHTTRSEQQLCSIKSNFAKIDRIVRNRKHRYIQKLLSII